MAGARAVTETQPPDMIGPRSQRRGLRHGEVLYILSVSLCSEVVVPRLTSVGVFTP